MEYKIALSIFYVSSLGNLCVWDHNDGQKLFVMGVTEVDGKLFFVTN